MCVYTFTFRYARRGFDIGVPHVSAPEFSSRLAWNEKVGEFRKNQEITRKIEHSGKLKNAQNVFDTDRDL